MSAIGENAAGGLIASEVHGVIEMLMSRINAEIQLARGFKKGVKELQKQLTQLNEMIQGDSSGQSITNEVLKSWLEEVKDAVYDADILFDEWSYKALKRRNQNKVQRTVSWIFSRHVMAHKVRDMGRSISNIYNKAKDLGIKPVKVADGVTHEIEIQDNRLINLRERVDLQFFQGRDDDVKELVKLLCDPNNTNSNLTVIGIVGLAGLGKTTLSKHILELQEVIDFFHSNVIWLVISHNFDLMDILKKMEAILFGETPNMDYVQALILKLRTKMNGMKYLIILDDVWEDTIEWDTLQSTLNEIGVSKGTTLLVTSRNQKVVKKLNTTKKPTIYQLQELSPGNSWSLFMAKYCDEIEAGSEEENIAKRMIDKCRGVPLAIRVLAGLLRGKSIEEWREIKESEIWTEEGKNDIWTEEGKNDILPSLRLSYNYLPHIALKKCFAFCAIFEEDEVIEKQELIYMWMAQGFLQPKEKMEHLGDLYIEHLLSCSLFQEVERDEYDRIETFKMHDLVWTLARSVSMRECLCVCSENYAVTDEVRHLSIQRDIESRDLTSKSFTKLQTYLVGKYVSVPDGLQCWLLTCKHLRVLNVGEQACEKVNWKPLRSLIHLRYFAIEVDDPKGFEQSNLPNQITKLHHLQTLCINYIIHIHDPPVALFLKKINNLVNLRHISIYHCIGIPIGLSHLTALQTLPIIKLGLNWGGNISDIGLLTNLRGKLEIHCLRLLTIVEARSMDLVSKSNLDNLVLKWGIGKENPKANEILEALQPNKSLHKLELTWFDGTTFPKWLIGPDSPLINIVSLQIEWCEEADGNLKLENFICLRILKVKCCQKLTVTFPSNKSKCCKSLEQLQISVCDKVEELPDLFLMPKLKVIEIERNNSTSKDVLVGLGNLPCLNELGTDLKLPVDLGEDSPVCKSLEKLRLDGSKYYNGDTATDLPEQLQHLVALQSLSIDNFASVEAIPNWLGKLTSLKYLYLYDMPKLKQLPPQDVMQSLSNLSSFSCSLGCPILEEDFKNKSGEWFKISHIRHIRPM